MDQIRVLIVDDEEVFREGLVRLLSDQPHIDIVYHCGGRREAIEKTKETNPDVVLMDSQISDLDVLEAIAEIKKCSPEVKVVMISRPETKPNPLHILKAGAIGCLTKNITVSDLVKSIELISSGRIVISPLLAEQFLEEIASAEKADDTEAALTKSSLSEREIEVVRLIAEGNTNKETAEKLFIAESTVKVHVKNILSKLELRNRQQLVAYAVLQNWVTIAPSTPEEDMQVSN